MEGEGAILEQEGNAQLIKQQILNKNYTVLSSKEFPYSNFLLFSLVLNFGRARPSWPRKTLYAFTWKKITSILFYNQAAHIYWVMIACQQHAVSTLWCREIDMQSREIDSGVICILVRGEALQTDELSEKTGGEGKEEDPQSWETPPQREGGWQPPASWGWVRTSLREPCSAQTGVRRWTYTRKNPTPNTVSTLRTQVLSYPHLFSCSLAQGSVS